MREGWCPRISHQRTEELLKRGRARTGSPRRDLGDGCKAIGHGPKTDEGRCFPGDSKCRLWCAGHEEDQRGGCSSCGVRYLGSKGGEDTKDARVEFVNAADSMQTYRSGLGFSGTNRILPKGLTCIP